MAEYAITGDIATLLGGDHTTGDPAALWVECSQPILVVDGEGRIGGKIRVELNEDGTFTVDGLPETVAGTTPLYRLHYDSKAMRIAGIGRGRATGWFPLATNRDLTWIVNNYVDVAAITAEVAANVAAAAALGATNDSATASFIEDAGSATATALAEVVDTATTGLAKLPGLDFAAIGDSITDRNGPWGYTYAPYYPRLAWFRLAATEAGQRVHLANNYAISGKRTDEMVTEQLPTVLALTPRPYGCTVLGGTNDIGQGTRTAAQIIASLTTIYDALADAGILVIAGTIPPSTDYTGTALTKLYTVNAWIKTQAIARRGFHVVDFHTALADTTGAPASGVLADTVHQSAKGAALMGKALAPILKSIAPPFDPFPGPGDPANSAPNPYMTGTTGDLGTGVTGNGPTGWYIADAGGTPAVSAVVSKVARTDGIPGSWAQIVMSAGSLRFLPTATLTTGWAVGDTVRLLVEFETNSGATAEQLEAYIVQAGSSSTTGAFIDTVGYDGTDTPLPMPLSGVIATPPVTIGTGTTAFSPWVRIWKGVGTFRIGRVALVKV